jgi:DNA helicase-2/ATP-dependent DNA helicase PcrA
LDLSLSVAGGVTVTVRADHIASNGGKIVIQRLKQGRLAKSGEGAKMRYFVLQAAARQQYGNSSVEFEHVSLLTADRSSKKTTDKALATEIAKIEVALRDISAGHFPPTPDQYCPQCPFYFICPIHFRIGANGG